MSIEYNRLSDVEAIEFIVKVMDTHDYMTLTGYAYLPDRELEKIQSYDIPKYIANKLYSDLVNFNEERFKDA